MGIRRTILKLMNSQYYWPRMKRYAKDYVSSCHICKERKTQTRKKRSYMKTYQSSQRLQRIAADIAGPFPKSENGYLYILVVSDYFTKFCEICPLRGMETETVAETLFKGWIKRYGCPLELHCNQGRQFKSQLFQEMCKLLQINKTWRIAYQPQSDGMVERLNRTIKEMLSKYISTHQTNLGKYIDGIFLVYNNIPNETTTITPYRMMFGTYSSVGCYDGINGRQFKSENESEYVRNLENELYLVHSIDLCIIEVFGQAYFAGVIFFMSFSTVWGWCVFQSFG